jgi:hypothetical protein
VIVVAYSTAVTVPEDSSTPTYPALLSAEEFAEGTNGSYSSADPRVQPLLDGATTAIRRYCRWHVAPVVDETIVMDYDGSATIILPTLRLISVAGLKINGEELFDFEVSHNGEILLARPYLPRLSGVEISLRHGFDSAAVADVKQIIQQVVANAISSPLGATQEQAGQVSIHWSTTAPGVSGGISLLQRDLDTLNLYRLPGRA